MRGPSCSLRSGSEVKAEWENARALVTRLGVSCSSKMRVVGRETCLSMSLGRVRPDQSCGDQQNLGGTDRTTRLGFEPRWDTATRTSSISHTTSMLVFMAHILHPEVTRREFSLIFKRNYYPFSL